MCSLCEMLTRLNHRILIFALILSSANLFVQAEDLCMEGTLLFREDFGGNDPNDPVAGTNPAPGMTSNYMQIFDTATCIAHYPCTGMGSGRYLLTKIGYRNASSYTYSHWFIMDDHTFPNDYTRGYLLEIDGRTDNATLFETVINDLCEGTKLTFSAYVTNITTAYSYDHGNNGDPQLSFVLQDPVTGAELITPYKTGPIPVDRSYQGMPGEWRNSAHWQLVGMNFTVPAGRTAIKLLIKNACTASGGNDFAMDDIEIRLCAPPVTIDGEAEVCEKAATSLSADFTNDGTFPEPLEYKWWHSEDSVTWTELSETSSSLSIAAIQKADSGWYKVAVSGAGNIESVNCRAESAPFRLKVKECAPPEPEYELCMDGILLFREDFGGNNPEDPRVSTTPVPGMSYTQVTTDVLGSMGSGKYLVTKQGYCNGNGTSQWHLQDDHTYPDDLTRGYLLEIDGRAGTSAFYQTTIDHLCEGIELTFSAYVANVMTWGMYVGRPGVYAYPRLLFVLTNPQDNSELATYDTGDIPFDSTFIGDNMCWQQSVEWRLVGMNFTVPIGVESIQLSIYNNVSNFNGNDFAIDDIEIHLCMTPDTVVTDTTVCDTTRQIRWREKTYQIADTLRDTLLSSCGFDSIYYILHVEKDKCCKSNVVHGFSVSTDRQVFFAPGNLQYNPAQGSHLCADGTTQQGTWRFAEHQWDYIGKANENASATYNGWIDLFGWGTSGWSNGVEEYQPWSVTKGSWKRYYINGDAKISMTGEYKNADWAVYNSIGNDAPNTWRTLTADEWNFVLSERANASLLCGKATVNNVHGLIFLPDDYPIDDHSLPEFIPGNDRFCETNTYTENQWKQLENKGAIFLPAAGEAYYDNNFPNDRGFYWSASASNDNKYEGAYNLEFYSKVNIQPTQVTLEDRRSRRSVRPVWDIPEDYIPTLKLDTTVCDTLLPLTWRGHEWTETEVIRDTLQSICGTDSICLILSLKTEICCPDLITITADTTVCDTLMPYRWRDTLFAEPATYEILYKDQRDCDSVLYILSLDTIHCERFIPEPEPEPEVLYPIIVNKYNWQLLLDNVTLRQLFPNRTATAYQWYKNEHAIDGATEDDYSEQNELHGVFQLQVTLDGSQLIWSNILTILDSEAEVPVETQIYNWQHLYLIRYEQGDKVWVEKKLIP